MAKKKQPDLALPAWMVGMIQDLKQAGSYVEGMSQDQVRAAHDKFLASQVPEWPSEPVLPAQPSPFSLARDARVLAAREKLAADRALHSEKKESPYKDLPLLDITEIEGRSLAQWERWDEQHEELARKAHVTSKSDKLFVYDCKLPGWVVWALRKWHEQGRPTKKAQLKLEYLALQKAVQDKQKDIARSEQDAEKLAPGAALKKLELARKQKERLNELEAEASALYLKLSKAG